MFEPVKKEFASPGLQTADPFRKGWIPPEILPAVPVRHQQEAEGERPRPPDEAQKSFAGFATARVQVMKRDNEKPLSRAA